MNTVLRAPYFFALWCNGSTSDSGSACQGSNPCGATMKLQRITTATDTAWEVLLPLYKTAFPIEERRNDEDLLYTVAHCPEMVCNAIYVQQQVVGMSIYWNLDGFVYLEHFMILPEYRNQGIGAWVLQQLANSTTLPRILEVEPASDALTQRRVAMYERNGYGVVCTDYYQESYRKGEQGIPLWLMCSESLAKARIEQMAQCIKEQVYFRFWK